MENNRLKTDIFIKQATNVFVGEKMEGTLQDALQNGKAHPKMKKVWTIRWMFSFVMFFIFMMFFVGF